MTIRQMDNQNSVQPVSLLMIGAIALFHSVGCGANPSTAAKVSESQQAIRQLDRLSPGTDSPNEEQYASVEENPFVDVLSNPQSTFAVDVDTASYSNLRRLIRQGVRPEKGAIRLEELVNYFPYSYPEPVDAHPFSVSTEIAGCPWNAEHQLVRVAIQGKSIAMEDRKACNLVFLLDVSGSMQAPVKLPLVKAAMKLLVEQLRPSDRVAIVVYAGASGLVLDSTAISESHLILNALDSLSAGGSTNGGAGIELAYKIAKDHFVPGGVNRVVLCTDGDFNVGTTSESALVDLIQTEAQKNVYLSVLGFGTGNIKDSTMEKLADRGNGNYAYIDSLLEARKILIDQIGGTLVTIAKDVKTQLDFNPQFVSAYRLLGYENRILANADFRDDSKDAGEIGAGHRVTAFYELVPVGSKTTVEASRKSEFVESQPSGDSSTMLTVNMRYKDPGATVAKEFQLRHTRSDTITKPSNDFMFASSVLAYGMLLRKSEHSGDLNWEWVIKTAESHRGDDKNGLRSEFIQLAKAASQL
jgi:Ca-activated chloride channel family protein